MRIHVLPLPVSCALATTALLACGAVSEAPIDAGGDFSLTVTPNALAVPIASSRTATLGVQRVGNPGDIVLSAQNLPAGVSVTFATNPIPAGANTSEITVAIAGGSAAGSHQITIVGTATGLERTATFQVTAETITVSGKVRGDRQGVTVGMIGKASVTSGPGGTFTFNDVTPPYDLYTFGMSGFSFEIPTVIYYDNLTRIDPVIDGPSGGIFFFPIGSNGTISGAKLGSGNTSSPLVLVWSTGGKATTVNDVGGFSFSGSWVPQSSTRSGTLYGLQWTTKTNGAPDTFLGYGSTNATLTSGQTTSVNVTLAAPQTAALTGTISAPSGFPAPTLTLNQLLGAQTHTLWTQATTAVDATIPIISAGKSSLHATSTVNGARTSFIHPALDGARDVSFALPAPAFQSMPVNNATGVNTQTPFAWMSPAMTVNTVFISTDGTNKALFQLLTTAQTISIPVIPELGLPANQSFTWTITGHGPAASIDDAATAAGLEFVSTADYEGPVHFQTSSANRTFTSAP